MSISTYPEAREYLESFIRPTIAARIEADSHLPSPLVRMQELLARLGNPEKTFKSVQISGTAGKGSTSYLLSQIMTKAGYKTGLTLSPHLEKLNERIQINGVAISDTDFLALLQKLVPVIEAMRGASIGEPSYFEILVAMAFQHFSDEKVDIAIVEVGLEGRLDGTNTIDPLITVITNIDLDHVELLGDTVEEITGEASSIIKKNQIVISGSRNQLVTDLIEKKSLAEGANFSLLDRDFSYAVRSSGVTGSVFTYNSNEQNLSALVLSLVGSYQVENATIAIHIAEKLTSFGFTVSETAIRDALTTASFPGRFELINYHGRALLLDGAHNEIKMKSFLSSLEKFYPEKKKVFIVTFKKGKAVKPMLEMIMQSADELILTEFHRTIDNDKNASITSSILSEIQSSLTNNRPKKVMVSDTAHEAFTRAVGDTENDDLIIITGSLYLVGEIREIVTKE